MKTDFTREQLEGAAMGVIMLNRSHFVMLNPFLVAQQYLHYTENLADTLETKMDGGEELTIKMLEEAECSCEGHERFSMLDDTYLLLKMVWIYGDKVVSLWSDWHNRKKGRFSLFAARS